MKVRTALMLALLGTAFAQGVPVEMSYYPAPATLPNANLASVVSFNLLKDVVIEFAWNSIDSDGIPAHFSWTAFDAEVASYASTFPNIKLGVVFAPVSDVSPNVWTPDYIMKSTSTQYCECTPGWTGGGSITNTCITSPGNTADTQASPVMWNSFVAAHWQAFAIAAIAHMRASVNAGKFRYVVFGEQRGGEAAPTCNSAQYALASPATEAGLKLVWSPYAIAMNTAEAAAVAGSQILVFDGIACVGVNASSTTNNCDWAAMLAAAHNCCNVGLRVTSVRDTDRTNWNGNAPAAGDWVALFRQYPNLPIDWQDSTASDPSGDSCQTQTGQTSISHSLTTLVPFMVQNEGGKHPVAIYEILSSDANAAYAGQTDAHCWLVACLTGSCPYAPYDAVLRAAALGLPTGTHTLGGHSRKSGTVVSQ